MQITFGTHIKSLVGKPKDGLIPIKLELNVSNQVIDDESLKTRGRTVSLCTKLSANKTKTVAIDNQTSCEITIERSEPLSLTQPISETK